MDEQMGKLAAHLPGGYPFPDLLAAAPELALATGALVLLLLGVFLGNARTRD